MTLTKATRKNARDLLDIMIETMNDPDLPMQEQERIITRLVEELVKTLQRKVPACANRGRPFDQAAANAVHADIEAAGGIAALTYRRDRGEE